MKAKEMKPPKPGRFHEDVFGLVERNVIGGGYRVTWFFWFERHLKDDMEPHWGQYESRIFGRYIGGDEDGPRIYPEPRYFKSAKRALRHYHRVMAHADLVAARRAEHQRSERDDWVVVR